jgi:hypothetical protein
MEELHKQAAAVMIQNRLLALLPFSQCSFPDQLASVICLIFTGCTFLRRWRILVSCHLKYTNAMSLTSLFVDSSDSWLLSLAGAGYAVAYVVTGAGSHSDHRHLSSGNKVFYSRHSVFHKCLLRYLLFVATTNTLFPCRRSH